MSFFSAIKKIFDHTITVPEKCLDNLIYVYSPHDRKIKMGLPFEVPLDFTGVIVSKSQVCDEFSAGKYKFLVPYMPITTKLNKLSKLLSNNTFKPHFKGYMYFISSLDFEEDFGNFIKVELCDDYVKNCKGKFTFRLKFRVHSAKTFLHEILKDNGGIVTSDLAKECLGIYVEDIIAKWLKARKITPIQFLNKDFGDFEDLKFTIMRICRDVGIAVSDVEITKTSVSESVYQKLTMEYGKLNFEENLNNPFEEDIILRDNSSSLRYLMRLTNIEKKIEEYEKLYLIKQNRNRIKGLNFKNITSLENIEVRELSANNMVYKNNIVNDNLTSTVNNDVNIKKCPSCNSVLPKNVKKCFNCLYVFEK